MGAESVPGTLLCILQRLSHLRTYNTLSSDDNVISFHRCRNKKLKDVKNLVQGHLTARQ
jgi:hypothetical protein